MFVHKIDGCEVEKKNFQKGTAMKREKMYYII